MTRDEAKALMTHKSSKGAVLRYESNVDKIYDSLELRTCEICKYFDLSNENCTSKELLSNFYGEYGNEFVPDMHKFYCSEWEKRND